MDLARNDFDFEPISSDTFLVAEFSESGTAPHSIEAQAGRNDRNHDRASWKTRFDSEVRHPKTRNCGRVWISLDGGYFRTWPHGKSYARGMAAVGELSHHLCSDLPVAISHRVPSGAGAGAGASEKSLVGRVFCDRANVRSNHMDDAGLDPTLLGVSRRTFRRFAFRFIRLLDE